MNHEGHEEHEEGLQDETLDAILELRDVEIVAPLGSGHANSLYLMEFNAKNRLFQGLYLTFRTL